jgi:hypothetical protein
MGRWHEPASDTAQDSAAAVRMREFQIGWLVLHCPLVPTTSVGYISEKQVILPPTGIKISVI